MLKMFKKRPARWLSIAACLGLLIAALDYLHWDDRLLFLWQELIIQVKEQQL